MKNFRYLYIFLAFAAATMWSCSEIETGEAPYGVELGVIAMPNTTKSDAAGEDAYNENLINSIHYFFYAKEDHSHALIHGVQSGMNVMNQASVRVNMDEGTVNNILFPRPENKCDVYIIVNLPAGTAIPDNTSLESIKAMAVQADFSTSETQRNFVMQGLGEATIINRKQTIAASGTIPVDRIAAKLTIGVIVPEKYELKDSQDKVQETWIPQPEGLKIKFHNGKSTASVGSDPQHVGANHFDSDKREFSSGTLAGAVMETGDKAFACKAPFYSYPEEWNLGEDSAPFLTITLPWAQQTGTGGLAYQNCYYKVLLNGTSLQPNNWYNINVKLGVLGSFTEADPIVEIQDNYVTYYVEDWTEALKNNENIMLNIVQAEIKGAQYLVVPNNRYTIYNQDSIVIPFSSSHECEIVDVKATKTDYSKNPPSTSTNDATTEEYGLEIVNGKIVFDHQLNNNVMGSNNYDVAPYLCVFKIQHKEDPRYSETITVVQYPALFITNEANPISSFGQKNRYVFINNTDTDLGSNPHQNDLNPSNKNPNMYVITTTSLGDSEFILGDPRTSTVNNLNYNSWASVKPATGGNNRTMKYYYPTSTDPENANVIAPKFRIASSWGATTSISYTKARQRCAGYQENGYPAGRWRLPTKAEIQYIVKLSRDGKIPELFTVSANSGNGYWYANGELNKAQYNDLVDPSSSRNEHAVRCVYDEWYWENSNYAKVTTTTFTWGDMPRDSFN